MPKLANQRQMAGRAATDGGSRRRAPCYSPDDLHLYCSTDLGLSPAKSRALLPSRERYTSPRLPTDDIGQRRSHFAPQMFLQCENPPTRIPDFGWRAAAAGLKALAAVRQLPHPNDTQKSRQVFTGVPVHIKHEFTRVPKISNKFSPE